MAPPRVGIAGNMLVDRPAEVRKHKEVEALHEREYQRLYEQWERERGYWHSMRQPETISNPRLTSEPS